MSNTINVGVIGCDMSEEIFETSSRNKIENFYWKKIFNGNKSVALNVAGYPNAEIVEDVQEIVKDGDISLVFVSKKQLDLVPLVMQAGKSIRIV